MSEADLEHHLAAIFSADAVGYTRLLAEDEPATIRALAEAREQIAGSVSRHRGRVVDATGDNLLAEFPSALDAVRCSVEVQRALGDRAAGQPAERRMPFRIGLHLGDVAVDDARIFGDGVNVAARLQTLAEPGGICLSAAIHENVRSRLDLPFHDLGDQSLKNFPRPVRAFRVGGDPAALPTPLEPPDRPSLVVIPFANVSGDAEQEYFADGMSEDLISELARVPGLFVIGRSTSFTYKGKSVAARELGRELGVRHLVEGSVRRAGSRVRITARLTEANSGREIWSERYDRELGDVFALQDEVVGGVVTQLRRALGAGIEHTPRDRPVVRPEAWELLVQARAQLDRPNTPVTALAARATLQRCVELAPDFAAGWAELGRCEQMAYFIGIEGEAYFDRALEHARRALELNPDEPIAHMTLGMLSALRGDAEPAVASARCALELAPGDANLRLQYGTLLIYVSRVEEAIPVLKNLTRLDPSLRYMHLFQVAICYRRMGRLDESIAKHRESLQLNPNFIGPHMNLAAIYTQLGELHQARESLAELMRLRPDFSIRQIPRLPSGREFLVENLRKAGLRE